MGKFLITEYNINADSITNISHSSNFIIIVSVVPWCRPLLRKILACSTFSLSFFWHDCPGPHPPINITRPLTRYSSSVWKTDLHKDEMVHHVSYLANLLLNGSPGALSVMSEVAP